LQFSTEYESAWADARKKMLITKTGDWRFRHPVTKTAKCRQCGWCYLYCPTGCVSPGDDGYFRVDMEYCKGCGICAYECPAQAIVMVREEVD